MMTIRSVRSKRVNKRGLAMVMCSCDIIVVI